MKTNLNNLIRLVGISSCCRSERRRENGFDPGKYRGEFYLHPDSANPVKLWVNDYDQNGNMDNILSKR